MLAASPSAAICGYLAKQLPAARITVGDREVRPFHGELRPPHRMLPVDITHLIFPDQCFDLILGGGILPSIRSDYLAMSEMHRCLKNEGVALLVAEIQLPKTKRGSEMRGEHSDLEWVYGEDFFERLEAAGFFHYRLRPPAEMARLYGIPPSAELVCCFKFRDCRDRFTEGFSWINK